MPSRFLQNRYYLLARLGRGGFGVTYKAEDRSLPERPFCVVKQLKPAQSDPETLEAAQRLFKREAEVQRVWDSTITSPN
ncbi:MAG: hypothetical protein HC890_14130 [Chloroflexaceae bacterium]|nr:hypothetical protein [Chloroflexaceae bacterium]